MTGTWWFEDVQVGQRFVSQGRTITESDIASFAAWSWDTNPVHTDAARAKAGRIGLMVATRLPG